MGGDFHVREGSVLVGGNPPRTYSNFYQGSSYTPKIGPKVEFMLNEAWSVESAILFQQPVYTSRAVYDPPWQIYPDRPPLSEQSDRYNEAVFEIPVLAKYRAPVWTRRLVLEVGPSFRPFGGFDGPGRIGITGGVGIAFHAGAVRLQPTVRYTRMQAGESHHPTFRQDNISLLLVADIPSTRLPRASRNSPLSVGFIGGSTFTGGFPARDGYAGRTTRMAGIALAYQPTRNWAVEANVLYHPLILSERARATVLTWEIPFLARYRFGGGKVRPFLAAGPSFRASGNRNNTNPSITGFTTGGGVEFRRGRWSVEPMLRYVRWGRDSGTQYAAAFSNPNQIHALLSIRFGGD